MSSNNFLKSYEEIQSAGISPQKTIKELRLPVNVQKFLNCLQKSCFNLNSHENEEEINDSSSVPKVVEHAEHASFCSKFQTLLNLQKEYYLEAMIEVVYHKLLNKHFDLNVEDKQTDFYCYLRNTAYYIPHWTQITLRWSCKRKKLTIIQKHRAIELYLKQFLIRKSKVHPYCLVLENINFVLEGKQNNFHIRFQQQHAQRFNELEKQIKKMVAISHAQSLLRQINDRHQTQKTSTRQKNSIMAFLTASHLNKLTQVSKVEAYLNNENRSTIQTSQISNDNSNKSKLTDNQKFKIVKQTQQIKIEVNQINPFIYRAKIEVSPKSNCLQNFLQSYMNNHKMIWGAKIIEQLKRKSSNKYIPVFMAVVQKIIWKDKIYSQFCITKQQMTENQPLVPSLQNQIFTFTLQNIDDMQNVSFIQNALLTVKEIDQNTWIVSIYACFCKSHHFEKEAILQYLQNFIRVFERENQIDGSHTYQNNLNNQIYLHPQFNLNQEHLYFGPMYRNHSKYDQKRQNYLVVNNLAKQSAHNNQRKQDFFKKNNISKHQYLKHHYRFKPTRQKIGVIMKEHFLWNNWKRAENGGLVCKNQQLVQRQKEMYKVVLKKFGQTLLTGKNIINFSLPVIVFKKQSHLQSLAKSYLFSPLYVEKAATLTDPLERMKYSIIIMMTENALSIHMQKPFNPILGETFQGWIDGCPMYLEQISHHPPISAYYFIGRGFKKYGCIEPRISIGLNTGSGYSIFPHYVQFDDGMKIQYICAKIAIGGLLIGVRTFNFEDKIYAYDRKHRYFASLSFGPVEKGLFKSSGEPNDYFHGYIYEVTPSFQEYFDSKEIKPHPEKQHMVKKLTFFDGIWNSSVNVNSQEVINFKTDLPYQFVDEAYPLPSDSIYRQDLSNLRKGDVEAAQTAKQDMQQMQRYDRKLRENHAV